MKANADVLVVPIHSVVKNAIHTLPTFMASLLGTFVPKHSPNTTIS